MKQCTRNNKRAVLHLASVDIPIIYLDNNEAAEGKQLKGMIQSCGVKVEVKSLPCDAIIQSKDGSVIAIERKAVVDFANSIRNRHLWDQCSVLSEYKPNAYLVLEGYLPLIQKVTKMPEKSVRGMINAVLDGFGIKMVPSANTWWTAQWLAEKTLDAGNPKERKELSLRTSAKAYLSDSEKALYVMEGIVGHQTAKAILREYGSIAELASWLYGYGIDDKLRNIKLSSGRRISTKDVEKLYKVITTKYVE